MNICFSNATWKSPHVLGATVLLASLLSSSNAFSATLDLVGTLEPDCIEDSRFGNVLATGDLNGDGYDDVIVSNAPLSYRVEGYTKIYLASVSGRLTYGGEITVSASSLATADVNNDGFDDLIVGSGHSAALFFGKGGQGRDLFGSRDWDDADWKHDSESFTYWSPLDGKNITTSERFGETVAAVGDINGDNIEDFAVGAPGRIRRNNSGAYDGCLIGAVYFFLGSNGAGPVAANPEYVTGEQCDSGFASVLARGGMALDGSSTALVGVPRFDMDFNADGLISSSEREVGMVETIRSSGPVGSVIVGEQIGNLWFGSSVGYAGDIDHDGFPDALVGRSTLAKVFFYPGEGNQVLSPTSQWSTERGEWQNASVSFGAALGGVGDINNDGYADILVGDPMHDGNPGSPGHLGNWGRIYIWFGSQSGVGQGQVTLGSTTVPQPYIIDADGSDGEFGASFAAGDINGDGYGDLIVGSPRGARFCGGGIETGLVKVYLSGFAPPDRDSDGVPDAADNCPATANGPNETGIPGVGNQSNTDGDARGDACDNCPDVLNNNQSDVDGDAIGDVCDLCVGDPDNDGDGDGICAGSGFAAPQTGDGDNCPLVSNEDQTDNDTDGIGNACDNCPSVANQDQFDADNDSVGDLCDNCRDVANTNQADNDTDTLGNACDNCPDAANYNQSDADGDGQGDLCDVDADDDGVMNVGDNCPLVVNPDQSDVDNDGVGGLCDNCPDVANPDQADTEYPFYPFPPYPGYTDFGDACQDSDRDGDPDITDCNDSKPLIHHGAMEYCGTGIDYNCDGIAASACLGLQDFAPIVYLSEPSLRYFPVPIRDFEPKVIDSMLQESDLNGPLHCTKKFLGICYKWSFTYDSDPTSLQSLYRHDSTDYYLNMDGADPGYSSFTVPAPGRFDKYTTNIYGREASYYSSSTGRRFKVFQYWFFYPYNNWVDRHEGDLELVQVITDADTQRPLKLTYSWHLGGTTCDWESKFCCEAATGSTPAECEANGGKVSPFETLGETHPVVYVAYGSHASYPTPGEHPFEQKLGYCVGLTDDAIPQKRLVPEGVVLDVSEIPADLRGLSEQSVRVTPINDATKWVKWRGYWGENELFGLGASIGTAGPPSPYHQKVDNRYKWRDPIAYANNPNASYYTACVGSPVRLHVYDSQGNHAGKTDSGELDTNIEGLYLYGQDDEAIVAATSDDLVFKVEAVDAGEFGFSFNRYQRETSTETTVVYDGVSIQPQTLATVRVTANNPSYLMEIDSDGDGNVDLTKSPDSVTHRTVPTGDLPEDVVQETLPADIDGDGDGVRDTEDNCPTDSNPDQADLDGNGHGDVCDDADADGLADSSDNCPLQANADQQDGDGDGVGDVCDACPADSENNDLDEDGLCGEADPCPMDPLNVDADEDGFCQSSDCDDTASGIHPGVVEICDAIDNNCNGKTDEGDVCAALPGDLNGDAVVDAADQQVIRASLGKCTGDADFVADADYDGDGCVTYGDYRIWYGYYKSNP